MTISRCPLQHPVPFWTRLRNRSELCKCPPWALLLCPIYTTVRCRETQPFPNGTRWHLLPSSATQREKDTNAVLSLHVQAEASTSQESSKHSCLLRDPGPAGKVGRFFYLMQVQYRPEEGCPERHMHMNSVTSARVAQRHSETEPTETRVSDTLKVFFIPWWVSKQAENNDK